MQNHNISAPGSNSQETPFLKVFREIWDEMERQQKPIIEELRREYDKLLRDVPQ